MVYRGIIRQRNERGAQAGVVPPRVGVANSSRVTRKLDRRPILAREKHCKRG